MGITGFSQSGEVKNKINIFPLQSLNSEEREFSPVLFQGKLVFVTSQLKMGLPDPISDEAYYDLLVADMKKGLPSGKSKNFSVDINTPLHEGPCSFSTDGKKIFFTRSNQLNGAPILDEEGKIFNNKECDDKKIYLKSNTMKNSGMNKMFQIGMILTNTTIMNICAKK